MPLRYSKVQALLDLQEVEERYSDSLMTCYKDRKVSEEPLQRRSSCRDSEAGADSYLNWLPSLVEAADNFVNFHREEQFRSGHMERTASGPACYKVWGPHILDNT